MNNFAQIKQKKNRLYQRFEHLNNAPMAILVAERKNLAVGYANAMALTTLRTSPEDLLGKPLSAKLPDLFSVQIVDEIYATCFTAGQSYQMHDRQLARFTDRDLDVSWVDISIQPVRDDKEIVIGVMIFFSDVTSQIISRKSIVHREEYLGTFFKQAPVALVCYRGPEFIVDFANDKALEMWGKSLEDIKGRRVDEIFPEVKTDPKIRERHAKSVEKLGKGETHIVNEVELVFPRGDGAHTGWYTYIHEPYTDLSGKVIGMMAVAIEVTDQVLARKKLQLITDALPSLISYVNNNEEYEFVNKAYETWFGRAKSEFVGHSIIDVLGPKAYEKAKAHIENALSGKTDSYDAWINYKDGGQRFISASYIPHLDENKRVLGYFGLVNDLTERKNQEQALLENEERLRLIIEGIGAGTFDYDVRTGVIHCSNELKSLLGFSKGEILDLQTARSIVHPDDLATVVEQLNDLDSIASTGYVAIDYRIIRKDNDAIRWMHTRSKVLLTSDDKKQPARIIGFSIDITDRKSAEEKLKKFNRQLERDVQQRTSELSNANQLLVAKNEEFIHTHSVLQQLIDSSIEYIAVIDRDYKFLAVNRAFEKFVRKSRMDLLGKHIFEAYQGAKGSHQVELLKKAMAGETLHLKLNPSITRPNEVWFDTHYVPLVINEKIEGVIVLSRDITDIVKSGKELSNLNRQLAEAQRLAKLGSWEWDIATGNVEWSDEMYRIYGYDEKFPVDFVRATERMSPEDAERSSRRTHQHIQHAIDNFHRTGELVFEISSIEFAIQLPTGERKVLQSSGKIQLTPEGKLYRILGAIQDVTQIRSAEEKLRVLVEELESKNMELESFNYVASHDLQEPLRKIQTFIDRIKGGSINPEAVSEYLSRIDNSAKRMGTLIQSMLALSRLSKHDDDFTEVDLNITLANCKLDFELLIKEKNARIEAKSLPTIRGSEFQMRQLIGNLISNSLKFSNETPLITIDCSRVNGKETRFHNAQPGADYWCITFADNGIGFDPKYKDKIFELFQRLHSRREFSGTGIGLSIVKRVCERHKGFIEATSEPGKGARFAVWLPC